MPTFASPPEGYTRTHIKWDGGWMEFDVVVRQSVEHDGQVTEHPVDEGSDITDHYRPTNPVLNLEAEITDSPLSLPLTHTDGAQAIQDVQLIEIPAPIVPGAPTSFGGFDITVKRAVSVSTLNYSDGMSRVKAVYDDLVEIRNKVKVLTVSLGGLEDYDNMILKRFSIDRDNLSSNSMPLSLEFHKITFAELSTVDLSSIESAAAKRASKARSAAAANRAAQAKEEADTKSGASLAKRAASAVTDALSGV